MYILQFYTRFPFAAEYRLMVYALLGLVALGLIRKLADIPMEFWVLGVAVAWSGVHTYFLSDVGLAIHATARFANVMILAHIAAVLLLHSRQMRKVFPVIYKPVTGCLLWLIVGYGDRQRQLCEAPQNA